MTDTITRFPRRRLGPIHRISMVLAMGLLAFVAMSSRATEAEAQVRVGPHVGYSFDVEEVFIGADVWVGIISLSDMLQIHGNLGFSYYLVDIVSLWRLELNVPFLFDIGSFVSPYLAPGVAILQASVGDISETDVGFNVIAGGMFLRDNFVNPYAQLRFTFEDGTSTEIMGGVMLKF